MAADILEVRRPPLHLLAGGVQVAEAALEGLGLEDRGRARLGIGPIAHLARAEDGAGGGEADRHLVVDRQGLAALRVVPALPQGLQQEGAGAAELRRGFRHLALDHRAVAERGGGGARRLVAGEPHEGVEQPARDAERHAGEARRVEMRGAEAVERRVHPPVGVGVALHRVGVGDEQVLDGVGVAAGAAQADDVPGDRSNRRCRAGTAWCARSARHRRRSGWSRPAPARGNGRPSRRRGRGRWRTASARKRGSRPPPPAPRRRPCPRRARRPDRPRSPAPPPAPHRPPPSSSRCPGRGTTRCWRRPPPPPPPSGRARRGPAPRRHRRGAAGCGTARRHAGRPARPPAGAARPRCAAPRLREAGRAPARGTRRRAGLRHRRGRPTRRSRPWRSCLGRTSLERGSFHPRQRGRQEAADGVGSEPLAPRPTVAQDAEPQRSGTATPHPRCDKSRAGGAARREARVAW